MIYNPSHPLFPGFALYLFCRINFSVGTAGDGGGPDYTISIALARMEFFPIYPAGSPSDPPKFPPQQLQALKDCIKELFKVETKSFAPSGKGANGSYSGVGPNSNTLSFANDATTFSTADLNMIFYGATTPPAGAFDKTGLTTQGMRVTKYYFRYIPNYLSLRKFSLSTSYSASDSGIAGIWSNQIHELGHQLAQSLGLAPVNTEDSYATKLQDCVNQKSNPSAGKPK